MSTPAFLGPLALVLLAALAAAWLVQRVRQPPLVGFLAAGILLGPYGLGLVKDVSAVETLAEVGVVLLLFTVGLDLSVSSIRRLGRIVWIAGPLQFFGVVAAAAGLGALLGEPFSRGVLFGFLVVTCTTVILLKLLMDRGETDSPHGRFLVGINLFGDLMVVPMMLLVAPLSSKGSLGLGALALALGKAAVTVIVIAVAARKIVPRLLAAMVRTRQKELFTLAVLLLVFGTALGTAAAGLSLALGAFLAGLVVSESEFGHQAVADVAPFRDAFSALFFVSVGMLFDPRVLLNRPIAVASVLAFVLVGKAVLGALPVLLLGYGARVAVVVGISLAQIGEFSFVLLSAAHLAGGIDRGEYQAILAAAIASMIATPFLFEASHGIAQKLAGGTRGAPESKASAPGDAPVEGHVVILGFGHTGETLARVLGRSKIPFRILELNPERVARARGKDLAVEYGDASNDSVLRYCGIERARAALVLLSDPRATRRAVRLCRDLAPGVFLIARTRYLAEIPEIAALGADEVVAEEFETSLEISSRTLKHFGFPLPWVEAETSEIRRERHERFRGFDEVES